MIREFNIDDMEYINNIGSLIKDDFTNKNNIKDILSTDYRYLYVYEDNKEIKGFIEIEKHFEIIDLVNIAVLEEYQRDGIATMLINYIFMNMNAEKMLLEVRENNIKAIKFYEKNGFKEINRRKKYYGNEDAIIMERSI